MTNVSAAHNGYVGISLLYSTDTSMMKVSAAHNRKSHIAMMNTANTYMTNKTSLIIAYDTTNIVFKDTSFSNMYAPSIASSASEPTSLYTSSHYTRLVYSNYQRLQFYKK